MLHIAVCDDEKAICKQIQKYIEDYSLRYREKNSIDIFYNGEDLHDTLEKGQHYDLIFLDIDLYFLNGIEIGNYIRNILHNETTQIVFISAKQEYAIELFAVRPLDFIVKPVTPLQVERCLDFMTKQKQQQRTTFTYQVGNITKNIPLTDILHFESNARKILIFHQNGHDEFYGKLDDINEQLKDYPFLRIHKSFYVNYLHINVICQKDVVMENGTLLTISRPKLKEVLKQLNEIRKKGVIPWS